MYKPAGFARAACIAMVLALAGFSYAIATAGRSVDVASAAGTRAVSTNLNFANPFADPTLTSTLDRDLGDAVIGSAVVRRVNAVGGVRPYTFTSAGATGVGTNTSLALDNDGLFHSTPVTAPSGTQVLPIYGPLTGSPGLFRFIVTVSDNSGTNAYNKTEPFRLNILANTVNNFRFAVGPTLSNAVQFNEYQDYVATINGKGPYTYTVSNVSAGGKAAASLESLGLTISNADGKIFGVPLQSGAITFTVTAKDSTGASAQGRNSTGTSQTFTINVAASTVVQDVIVVTSCTLSGDTATGGKDKATVKGVFNPMIFSKLGSTFTLRINNYTISGTISGGTKISNLSLETLAKTKTNTKGPALKGTINGKGQFSLSVSNESFGRNNLLGTITSTLNAMVGVTIGTQIDGTNAIALANTGKGTKFNAKYTLGKASKTGPSNPTLGGAFILTAVQGKDDTKGGTGDSFKVSALAVPPGGGATPITLTGATNANVTIGNNFSDTEAVTVSKGSVKTGKIDPKAANKVTKLSIASNGKTSYQTSFIATAQTGIPLSSKAATTGVSYATGVNVLNGSTTIFGGIGSLVIFPKGKGYTSQQK